METDKQNVGIMQKDFAEIVGVSAPTVSRWATKGFLALAEDGTILVDESLKKLNERYPEGVKASLQTSKRRSYWSKGPHCMTPKALESWKRLTGK